MHAELLEALRELAVELLTVAGPPYLKLGMCNHFICGYLDISRSPAGPPMSEIGFPNQHEAESTPHAGCTHTTTGQGLDRTRPMLASRPGTPPEGSSSGSGLTCSDARPRPHSLQGPRDPGVLHVREVSLITVRTMPIPLDAGRAACSDPSVLPLVDVAFAKPGGPEAQQMKQRLCRNCPIIESCFAWAMTHGEAGIWGGLSPQVRAQRGAPRTLPGVPRSLYAGIEGKHTSTVNRLTELGVTAGEVKRWAYKQGLTRTVKGRVALATVEAWAAAHQHDEA